jgi:hypothetical protein
LQLTLLHLFVRLLTPLFAFVQLKDKTLSVKGLSAQDGGAPTTELIAGTGRGGGVCGRAPNGEGGRLERKRGEEIRSNLS